MPPACRTHRPLVPAGLGRLGGVPDALATGVCAMPGVVRGRAQFGGDISGEESAILIRSHLDAFEVANLSRAKGAVVAEGGLLSHGAILVRELGVPCVIGVRPQPVPVEDGEEVFLDATRGAVFAASTVDAAPSSWSRFLLR